MCEAEAASRAVRHPAGGQGGAGVSAVFGYCSYPVASPATEQALRLCLRAPPAAHRRHLPHVSPDARGQAPGVPAWSDLPPKNARANVTRPPQNLFHSGKWEVVCGPAFQVIMPRPPA